MNRYLAALRLIPDRWPRHHHRAHRRRIARRPSSGRRTARIRLAHRRTPGCRPRGLRLTSRPPRRAGRSGPRDPVRHRADRDPPGHRLFNHGRRQGRRQAATPRDPRRQRPHWHRSPRRSRAARRPVPSAGDRHRPVHARRRHRRPGNQGEPSGANARGRRCARLLPLVARPAAARDQPLVGPRKQARLPASDQSAPRPNRRPAPLRLLTRPRAHRRRGQGDPALRPDRVAAHPLRRRMGRRHAHRLAGPFRSRRGRSPGPRSRSARSTSAATRCSAWPRSTAARLRRARRVRARGAARRHRDHPRPTGLPDRVRPRRPALGQRGGKSRRCPGVDRLPSPAHRTAPARVLTTSASAIGTSRCSAASTSPSNPARRWPSSA